MKKKDTTPAPFKVFVILMCVGVFMGIIDGIAFQVHVSRNGVGLFDLVPWQVLKAYWLTFPGNLLTMLWLLPWGFASVVLHVGGVRRKRRLKRDITEEIRKAEQSGGEVRS